jgi:PPOX class probable F420-dependent enzyme
VTTLTDAQAALVLAPNVGMLSTLRADGTAHLTPVWVDWDGAHLLVNTTIGRVKERHMRADPRVSVAVVDAQDVARYVSMTGMATLTTDGAEAHIDKMARKYLGEPTYPTALRVPGDRRVLARVRLTKVTSWNVD